MLGILSVLCLRALFLVEGVLGGTAGWLEVTLFLLSGWPASGWRCS